MEDEAATPTRRVVPWWGSPVVLLAGAIGAVVFDGDRRAATVAAAALLAPALALAVAWVARRLARVGTDTWSSTPLRWLMASVVALLGVVVIFLSTRSSSFSRSEPWEVIGVVVLTIPVVITFGLTLWWRLPEGRSGVASTTALLAACVMALLAAPVHLLLVPSRIRFEMSHDEMDATVERLLADGPIPSDKGPGSYRAVERLGDFEIASNDGGRLHPTIDDCIDGSVNESGVWFSTVDGGHLIWCPRGAEPLGWTARRLGGHWWAAYEQD